MRQDAKRIYNRTYRAPRSDESRMWLLYALGGIAELQDQMLSDPDSDKFGREVAIGLNTAETVLTDAIWRYDEEHSPETIPEPPQPHDEDDHSFY